MERQWKAKVEGEKEEKGGKGIRKGKEMGESHSDVSDEE